jgi:hypothetical protein
MAPVGPQASNGKYDCEHGDDEEQQNRLDRQRKAVAALERADQIHLADRDRLTKRLARPPR